MGLLGKSKYFGIKNINIYYNSVFNILQRHD